MNIPPLLVILTDSAVVTQISSWEISGGNEKHLERFPFVWKNRSFWWDKKLMEQSSPLGIFWEKGIASDVVLFSRFYRKKPEYY